MSSETRPRTKDAVLTQAVVAVLVLTFATLVALRIRRYANVSTNHQAMPGAISEEEERRLFQTPQGMYTLSDISANGKELPSERFRTFRPAHEIQPRPGERLCPVTRTRGNPDCTWVVGGQKYEFCCPPCIPEFVQKARSSPGEILPVEAYVQGRL